MSLSEPIVVSAVFWPTTLPRHEGLLLGWIIDSQFVCVVGAVSSKEVSIFRFPDRQHADIAYPAQTGVSKRLSRVRGPSNSPGPLQILGYCSHAGSFTSSKSKGKARMKDTPLWIEATVRDGLPVDIRYVELLSFFERMLNYVPVYQLHPIP
jgi:hypothetical protein